jgi:hypothetical protein
MELQFPIRLEEGKMSVIDVMAIPYMNVMNATDRELSLAFVTESDVFPARIVTGRVI